jgi:hypothetical protein
MTDSQSILDGIILNAIKTANEVERLTGKNDVIICKATIPLIIIDVSQAKRDLVEIQIRVDKDTLGWLYTADPKTNVVFIRGAQFLYTTTLDKFKAHVQKELKDSGKQYSEVPEVGKLLKREDGSITTYIDKEPLLQPSTI